LLRVLQEGPTYGSSPPRIASSPPRSPPGVLADLRARTPGARLELLPLRERREDPAARRGAARPARAGRTVTFSRRCRRRALRARLAAQHHRASSAHRRGARRCARSHRAQHLPAAVGETGAARRAGLEHRLTGLSPEDRALREKLAACIASHRGNLAGVARELGKDRTQIRRWMKRFGLTRGAE
jgi:transcriptional regulator of acetoin/glycerol metabolism